MCKCLKDKLQIGLLAGLLDDVPQFITVERQEPKKGFYEILPQCSCHSKNWSIWRYACAHSANVPICLMKRFAPGDDDMCLINSIEAQDFSKKLIRHNVFKGLCDQALWRDDYDRPLTAMDLFIDVLFIVSECMS